MMCNEWDTLHMVDGVNKGKWYDWNMHHRVPDKVWKTKVEWVKQIPEKYSTKFSLKASHYFSKSFMKKI